MLVASVLTGTLASKLKDHARLSARSAFRTQVLFDTDRLLQKAKNNDDILSVTCMQLSRLLDRSIVAYTKSENGMSTGRLFAEKKYTYSENLLNAAEQKAAEWAFQSVVDKIDDDLYDKLCVHACKDQIVTLHRYRVPDNALKYTEQGSEICVSAEKQGKYAVIRVADNGSGIPDDMKSHIFEMFYTGKSTVADSRRSFGIGLTLCKSIVELHGGTLTLRDNVPCGCVFTFTLPLSEVTLNE